MIWMTLNFVSRSFLLSIFNFVSRLGIFNSFGDTEVVFS